MYDDERLIAPRSYNFSPDSPFPLVSSLILSNHLLLGLAIDLFPCTSIHIALLSTESSSLRITYHMPIPLRPPFLECLRDFPHFRCPLFLSFLMLSSFAIHRSNRIFSTSSMSECSMAHNTVCMLPIEAWLFRVNLGTRSDACINQVEDGLTVADICTACTIK